MPHPPGIADYPPENLGRQHLYSNERERTLAERLASHERKMDILAASIGTEPRLFQLVAAGTFVGSAIAGLVSMMATVAVTIVANVLAYLLTGGVLP